MQNLIRTENLTKTEITEIIESAREFKKGKCVSHKGRHCALMFFENSTRTRFSFECALNRLGVNVYVFESAKSSVNKGEEMFDTINNLAAIGIDSFIIRTTDENLIENLAARKYYKKVHFINAGTGKTAHPTQALLDFYTIAEKLGDVSQKKIVIIGDIKHSRVAKSNIALLKKFGAKLFICSPPYFKEEIEGAKYVENLDEALSGADVAMCLRIQKERLEEHVSIPEYVKKYRISASNFPKNAILMHPGPVNRDIEITGELIDSDFGKTILNQAENGVYVRMAVIDKIFKEDVI